LSKRAGYHGRVVRRLLGVASFAALLLTGEAHAQPSPPGPLAGYAKAVSGQTLGYQSYSPLATTALLVRSTDGKSSIEWLTAPIPANYTASLAAFRWIAGYAVGTSKADRHYRLGINGRDVLTFTAPHDPSIDHWSIEGTDGVVLSFQKRWDDANGDRMGDMTLSVPTAIYRPGRALDLTVTGEADQSEDWYMTFEYAPGEWVQSVVQPALVRCATGACQVIDLRVYHEGPDVAITASAGEATFSKRVRDGFTNLEFPVPAVSKATPVTLRVKMGSVDQTKRVTLSPVTPRTYYILHHSHMDIGYNLTQYEAIARQMQNVRDALALARATRSYPLAARFKWNIESLWGVDIFMREATPAERVQFVAAVRDGSIGISANYANELTGIESAEELLHVTDYADELRKQYRFRLDTAFWSDVPNFSWPIVTALRNDGVRYFSTGPNYIAGYAGGGDRVGGTYKSADQPFWWIAPSGQGKVLFWMTGRGYSSFHNGNLQGVFGPPPDHALKMRNAILSYSDELQSKGYPYDIVQLRYTYPADNSPCDPHLSDFVRDWNAHYVEPKLVISTTQQMFDAFVRRYGKALPTRRGDLTPYWDDGAVSSAREETIARRASATLEQASVLSTMLAPSRFAPEANAGAWRNLLMWSEHTWGADVSTSDPDSQFERTQWLFKRHFALNASREAGEIVDDVLRRRDGTWATRFTVYNTASTPARELVTLGPLESTGGDAVVDSHGFAVPSQRLHDGRLAFEATVGALGSEHYRVVRTATPLPADAHASANALWNRDIRVEIDPKTGAIGSLTYRGHEYVNRASLAGLNSYLYMTTLDPKNTTSSGIPKITATENGPLVAEVTIVSDAPGTQGLTRTIRLISGIDRVEIDDTFDKTKVRDYESVHVAFPFSVPNATTRIDLGWGVMRPGEDQLPGANADFYPVRRWVDVSNADYGITLATPDAPLIEIGQLNDERLNTEGYRSWRARAGSSSLIYSYVLNNYWHTNFRADQEGMMTFHYALFPHDGSFHAASAHAFGNDEAMPMLVVPTTPNDSAHPLVRATNGIEIASAERDAAGRVRFHLYNPHAQTTITTLTWRGGQIQKLTLHGYELRTTPFI
jgi:alpha-mannosidase